MRRLLILTAKARECEGLPPCRMDGQLLSEDYAIGSGEKFLPERLDYTNDKRSSKMGISKKRGAGHEGTAESRNYR